MSKAATKAQLSSVSNLMYLAGKIRPLSAERDQLHARESEIDDELFPLIRSAKSVAVEAFNDLAKQAANEWKSAHGDEELTMEWVDARFSAIDAAVVEYSNHGNHRGQTSFDLMRFYQSVHNLIQPEANEDES